MTSDSNRYWCHGEYDVYKNGVYVFRSNFVKRITAKNEAEAACKIILWYTRYNGGYIMYEIKNLKVDMA